MEEVQEKLKATLINSDENSKTNYESLYKNWGKLGNQELRRKHLLNIQKSNRNCKLDTYRGILDLVNAIEEDTVFNSQRSYYRPSIYVAGFTKTSPTYNNVLMMSEWIIDKPEDFHENWFVVPCPKGTRTLVVAIQGTTKCYTKCGRFRLQCRTALPGGNPGKAGNKSRCCVLDCFYVESMNTMFVLDILAWNTQPMTDGETEFRHYWLKSQLQEIPELQEISKMNKLIFKLLPMVPCDRKSFNEFMMKVPHFENFTPILDGLLFYHKHAHYLGGRTPLVGWLFPFMVQEVLGADIAVNPAYMLEKPDGYVSQNDFILKFQEKELKKSEKKRNAKTKKSETEQMVTEESRDTTVPEPEKMVSEEIQDTTVQPEKMVSEEIRDTTVQPEKMVSEEIRDTTVPDTEKMV